MAVAVFRGTRGKKKLSEVTRNPQGFWNKKENTCNSGGRLQPAELRISRLPGKIARRPQKLLTFPGWHRTLVWWQRDPRAETNPA